MKNLCAVITAAGKSTRMGTPKLFCPIKNEFAFARLARIFFQCEIKKIFLSVPKQLICDEIIFEQLNFFRAQKIINFYDDWQMLGSIKSAIECEKNCDGIIICPIDCCFFDHQIIFFMKKFFERNEKKILIPQFFFQAGHPILISQIFFQKIFLLKKNQSIRDLIAQEKNSIKKFLWPEKFILANINEKKDHQMWSKNF